MLHVIRRYRFCRLQSNVMHVLADYFNCLCTSKHTNRTSMGMMGLHQSGHCFEFASELQGPLCLLGLSRGECASEVMHDIREISSRTLVGAIKLQLIKLIKQSTFFPATCITQHLQLLMYRCLFPLCLFGRCWPHAYAHQNVTHTIHLVMIGQIAIPFGEFWSMP